MIFFEPQLEKVKKGYEKQDPCHQFPFPCFILTLHLLKPSKSEGFLFVRNPRPMLKEVRRKEEQKQKKVIDKWINTMYNDYEIKLF